jgi:hypothetical protein
MYGENFFFIFLINDRAPKAGDITKRLSDFDENRASQH